MEIISFTETGDIRIILDGKNTIVPNDMLIPLRQRIKKEFENQGNTIPPYIPPGPTVADVRAECLRRLIALTGARDAEHLKVLISDASLEALALLHKGAANWSNDEKQRADQLSNHREAIKSLTDASKRIRSLPEIPADFKDNKFWTEGAA